MSVSVKILSCRVCKCEAVLLSVGVKILSCRVCKCEDIELSCL